VLLRNKLLEEAQELAEATEKDHVAAEAADLLYFAMVRVVAAGATLADIEAHLDYRSLKVQRRPGNAKKERIEAAAKILGKGGEGAKDAAREGKPARPMRSPSAIEDPNVPIVPVATATASAESRAALPEAWALAAAAAAGAAVAIAAMSLRARR